ITSFLATFSCDVASKVLWAEREIRTPAPPSFATSAFEAAWTSAPTLLHLGNRESEQLCPSVDTGDDNCPIILQES
ncbi:hypothetical protein LCGC14_2656290, partial [marine sediment metagenome]